MTGKRTLLFTLCLFMGTQAAASPTDTVPRVIIDGKRISRNFISLYYETDHGPYALQADYFTNDAELYVYTSMWNWIWPLTRKGVASAMHDVRCNPNTQDDRNTTSLAPLYQRWLIAEKVSRSMQLYAGQRPRVGEKLKVTWADWGSTTYLVIAATGSITLDENPYSEEASSTPGQVRPNAICPNAS